MAGDELRHQREPRRLDRRTYFRLTNGVPGSVQIDNGEFNEETHVCRSANTPMS